MKTSKRCAAVGLAIAMLFVFSACQGTVAGSEADSSSSLPLAPVSSGADAPSQGAPASASSMAPAPINRVVPDKQTVDYDSTLDVALEGEDNGHTIAYTDDGGTEHRVFAPMPTKTQWSASYANADVLVVIATPVANTLMFLGATSHNGGADWVYFRLAHREGLRPFGVQIGFTSKNDGWLVYQVMHKNKAVLYQTSDGGITWGNGREMTLPRESEATYTFAQPISGEATYTFASPEIGWATFNYAQTATPQVYETCDGGVTWGLAQVDLKPEMEEGLLEFDIWPVSWQDGHWRFYGIEIKKYGYPEGPIYHFFWDQDTLSWQWDDPGLPMPEGVSQIHFLDYVQSYVYHPPITYDSETGLEEQTASEWLLYDAVYHHIRTSGESIENGATIPYAWVNQMVAYQYGDTSFDARQMVVYAEMNEEGFVYSERYWGKGWSATTVFVLETAVTEDGNIEAVIRQLYGANPEEDNAYEDQYNTYQRSVFEPITVEGVPFFTLLHSEEIDPVV